MTAFCLLYIYAASSETPLNIIIRDKNAAVMATEVMSVTVIL